MKTKYINFGILIVFLFGIQACTKDFLELEPKDGLVEDNFYQTEDDAFLALVAIYDAFSVQNWQFVPTMSDVFLMTRLKEEVMQKIWSNGMKLKLEK
ncbi:MAG: hypothetical protein HC831_04685 [Chloroflexia bacterium]|nr:hypothetical protein [Chloroflexia bacterium]